MFIRHSLNEDGKRPAAVFRFSHEDGLIAHDKLSILADGFLVDALGVERKAASRYLHQLEDLGILSGHKIGRENLFVNNALMEVLSQA